MIKPGTVTNELMSHNDWIPTLCAIAGEPDIIGKCAKGYTANGNNYKVHLDGYDQSAFLTRRRRHDRHATARRARETRSSTPTTTASSSPCGRATTSTSSPSSALPGHDAGVGGAVHEAAPAEDLQSFPGSLRAGGLHVQHLLGLAAQPRSACTE